MDFATNEEEVIHELDYIHQTTFFTFDSNSPPTNREGNYGLLKGSSSSSSSSFGGFSRFFNNFHFSSTKITFLHPAMQDNSCAIHIANMHI
jgi:hypothetical protein